MLSVRARRDRRSAPWLRLAVAGGLAAYLLTGPAHSPAQARQPPLSAKPAPQNQRLPLRIDGEPWEGEARAGDVRIALEAAAALFSPYVPQQRAAPVLVLRAHGNPRTLFERGPAGEYQIELSASPDNPAQLVYQFAHELCHVLSNFEHNDNPELGNQNQWFEEALCEAAGLFALERLADTWSAVNSPEGLTKASVRLRLYAEDLLREPHRNAARGAGLAAWFRRNEAALRNDPYLRHKNEVVANALLPLFLSDPQRWRALAYIDPRTPEQTRDLHAYLKCWCETAPPAQRTVVETIIALFDFPIPAPDRSAPPDAGPGYAILKQADPPHGVGQPYRKTTYLLGPH